MIGIAFIVSLLYGMQVWGIYVKIEELEMKTQVVEDADMEIVSRQVELQMLGKEIGAMQNLGVRLNTHIELMGYVEGACEINGTQLIVLPHESSEDIGGYNIAKVEMEVAGTFEQLTGLIYQIEHVDRIGSVGKVDMGKRYIRVENSKEEILSAKIILSRLTSKESTTMREG